MAAALRDLVAISQEAAANATAAKAPTGGALQVVLMQVEEVLMLE
jgi:hypothetical protein